MPNDPPEAIVRDMAADRRARIALCIDKPMRGHNLMQAICPCQPGIQSKPGGLVRADYRYRQ